MIHLLLTKLLLVLASIIGEYEEPVCHAPTEDSVIEDCDYRDGAWHKEDNT